MGLITSWNHLEPLHDFPGARGSVSTASGSHWVPSECSTLAVLAGPGAFPTVFTDHSEVAAFAFQVQVTGLSGSTEFKAIRVALNTSGLPL